MGLNLMALLGAAGLVPPDEDTGNVIQVNGRKQPVPEPQYEAPTYRQGDPGPEYVDVNQAPPDTSLMPRTQASPQDRARQTAMKDLVPHKGMFGIKGTLRDVLGGLGDALLVGSGGQAMYKPKRDQEDLSDRMVGYGMGDPTQDQAAIQRAIAANPEFGAKLADVYAGNQVAQQNADTSRSKARTDTLREGQKSFAEGARLFGQVAGAIAQNPKQAAAMMPYLQKIKETYDLGDEFQIPGDADTAEAYRYGGTPSQSQLTNEDRDTRNSELARSARAREAVAKQNADANTTRANRPPAGRAPHVDSATNVDARVLNAVANGTANESQMRYYNERLKRGGGKKSALQDARDRMGGGGSAPAKAGSSGGKYVIRGGKLVKQ